MGMSLPADATLPAADPVAADARRHAAQRRLGEVYAAEGGRLLALATLLSGSRAAGEDLAHAVFTEAVRRGNLEPGFLRDPAWPWLRQVAVRMAMRQRHRLRLQMSRLHLLHPAADGAGAWPDATVDLVRALGRLPARMRTCVVLAYLEDQGTETIAAAMRCAPKTVENQLREGRQRLRALLEPGEEMS